MELEAQRDLGMRNLPGWVIGYWVVIKSAVGIIAQVFGGCGEGCGWIPFHPTPLAFYHLQTENGKKFGRLYQLRILS